MNGDEEIVHRELDTGGEPPASQIGRIVAQLEGKAEDELEPAWAVIDDVLDDVFSDPPVPEAQVEVTFSYEGYRITVEQNGLATFVETRTGTD